MKNDKAELTAEKSQHQAGILYVVRRIVEHQIDPDYMKELARKLRNRASKQESMAVLSPSYPQEKNDILKAQARACDAMADFVLSLREVQKLGRYMEKNQAIEEDIQAIFL